jgi:hypothetical protein
MDKIEKLIFLEGYCCKSDCEDCVLNNKKHNWKKELRINGSTKCLNYFLADDEEINKAIDLILNSTADEDIIRKIAELKKSKELDKAHDTNKLEKAIKDNVNSPSHYTDGKIEVIDYIEDKKLGFCLGNAIKYISRAGKKDKTKESEDIKKAIWYLKRHIKNIEGGPLNEIT